jgi:nitrate reductase beta subunit
VAEIYNWQIKRKQFYKYDPSPPKRQVGWVFDTNKCIACQTCTVACKTTWTPGRGQELMLWNNVESKPYGYFPLGWDVRILERLGVQEMAGPVYRGKTLFEAAPAGERVLGYLPDDLDYAHPNVGEDDSFGSMTQGAWLSAPHMQWMFYLPRICNHCTFPACLGACPRQSVYKRPEDGVVLIDQQRCRGYRECVRGCPYKKSFFNPVTRISEKCIGCYPRVEQGLQTQCTIACIGKIRLQGFVSTPRRVREDNPLDYLVHVSRVALPLYPQFGLEPNVYYIPPVHVPPAYLRQMFGWGAEGAIRTYRRAADDRRLLGALLLFGATPQIIHRYAVRGGHAIGFDAGRRELVRVPLREPVQVRAAYDSRYASHRTNIT